MVKESTVTKIITVFMPELVNEFNIREVAKKAGITLSDYNGILNTRNTASLNQLISKGEDLELEDKVARVDVDFDGEASRRELEKVVKNALAHLNARDRKVIELRFGIGTEKSETLEVIGREIGVTRERARQLEERILAKLHSLLRTYVLDLKSDLMQDTLKS